MHAHPLSLYLPSRAKLVVVYAPAERADTLRLFHNYTYIYSVVFVKSRKMTGRSQTNTAVVAEGSRGKNDRKQNTLAP